MEALLGLFLFSLTLLALASPIIALLALARTGRLKREIEETRSAVAALERRLAATTRAPHPPADATPTAPEAPPGEKKTEAPAAWPGASPRAPSPAGPRQDFIGNLGPKLLVAAGGLAVVVFLGFFVRYAWENDWVGPTGRVLSAAVFSLGLLAGGLGLMRREYRPLGQGLAASGLAGLYVTAFAAHTVYALLPRGAAAVFMVVVTVCAVLLAERLDARLLAGLAWLGGYLAPILLSTGEDRALSLFAYLLLLGTGAVWLDRRRPWPETLPLALAGTAVLYAAWYLRHFRPERFEVAASASSRSRRCSRSQRPPGRARLGRPWRWSAAARRGRSAAGADRPLSLLAVLAAQAAIAVLVARRWPWAEAVSAALAFVAVLVWHDRISRPSGGRYARPGTDDRGSLLPDHVRARPVARRATDVGRRRDPPRRRGSRLGRDRPRARSSAPQLLGAAAVALAAVHLVVGLASRTRGDLLRARVTLALAVSFLTIAIPVQLGLHGTTLAWAVEALVLLWLGVQQGSPLTRGFGYGVLLLAVGRLLVRHLPLHAHAFVPVLNPELGIWLAVVASLAVAQRDDEAAQPGRGAARRDCRRPARAARARAALRRADDGDAGLVRPDGARGGRRGRRGGRPGRGPPRRPERLGAVDCVRDRPAGGGAGSAQPGPLLRRVRAVRGDGGQGGAVRPRDAVDALPHALVPGLGVLLLAGAWLNLRFRRG